jgi:uroporphyrinogen III methyltransferase / synthase
MSSLAGKRVLVTRPRAQAEGLVEKLISLRAVPVLFPTIEIADLEDFTQLDRAIQDLRSYQWVIFTSVNGVEAFWRRMETHGMDQTQFQGVSVAAIGPATAHSLRSRSIELDFIPEEFVAEAILPGLGDVSGKKILLPRADIARKALVAELIRQGGQPEEIAVYRTIPAQLDPTSLEELHLGIDIATFTSSSTVRNYVALLGDQAIPSLKGAIVACIGPITAETARVCGLTVDIVASEYTVDGLVRALQDHQQAEKKEAQK